MGKSQTSTLCETHAQNETKFKTEKPKNDER